MIRIITKTDLTGLNSLSPKDWKFDYESFLMEFLGTDFFYAFVMRQDEKTVGTGNVFLKEKVGWLANIIVDKNHRGQGLGAKITKYLVDFLKEKGCETQLLIATELGEPVYQKIGFKKITDYDCFHSEVNIDFIVSDSIRALETSDLQNLYELDQQANDENRKHLLDKYYETGLGYFDKDNELLGCYLPDFGQGLILAIDEEIGVELLKLKHSQKGKKTMLPIENKAGINCLEQLRLRKGAKCSRMILGKKNDWNPAYIYSYGGGFCG